MHRLSHYSTRIQITCTPLAQARTGASTICILGQRNERGKAKQPPDPRRTSPAAATAVHVAQFRPLAVRRRRGARTLHMMDPASNGDIIQLYRDVSRYCEAILPKHTWLLTSCPFEDQLTSNSRRMPEPKFHSGYRLDATECAPNDHCHACYWMMVR